MKDKKYDTAFKQEAVIKVQQQEKDIWDVV